MPRVTVKRLQPFEALAASARFAVEACVTDAAAVAPLAALLDDHRGARGEVRLRLALDGGEAVLLLGRDFLLDMELVDRIEGITGVAAVTLDRAVTQLALVG